MLANLKNHDVDANIPALAQLARGVEQDIVIPVHQPRQILARDGRIDIARKIPRHRRQVAANEFTGSSAVELNHVIANGDRTDVGSAAVFGAHAIAKAGLTASSRDGRCQLCEPGIQCGPRFDKTHRIICLARHADGLQVE